MTLTEERDRTLDVGRSTVEGTEPTSNVQRPTPPHRPWGKRQAPRARMEGNLLPTNLTLTREQIEWLDARADREGRSRSDVARAVISAAISKEREREERRKKKETP